MGRSYIKATLIAAIVLVQMTAHAQSGANSSVSNNTQVASEPAKPAGQAATNAATASQDQSAKTGDATAVSTSQAPSNIKQEVTIVTSAAQSAEQPTTVVTAAPLAPSRAEEIRKARERAEVETEQGIVEKLEKDRLEDEQLRRDQLFQARKKKTVVEDVTPVVVAPVASPVVATTQVSAPTAQVQANPKADSSVSSTVTATTQGDNSPATATATITSAAVAPSEPVVVIQAPQKSEAELRQEIEADVRSDVRAESKADLKVISASEESRKTHISVGGVLTTMSYPDAFNTNSDFGAGVSLGWVSANRIGVEGTFLFSQHTIDDSYSMYKKVDQQNWMVAARYSVLPGAITPVVGALMSYTRRDYTDMYDWGYGATQGPGSASSDSLDVGLILGVEFAASKNIVLGVDYRYVTNLTTRYSAPENFNRSIYQSNDRDYRPLEEIDYDMVAFSLKFLF